MNIIKVSKPLDKMTEKDLMQNLITENDWLKKRIEALESAEKARNPKFNAPEKSAKKVKGS